MRINKILGLFSINFIECNVSVPNRLEVTRSIKVEHAISTPNGPLSYKDNVKYRYSGFVTKINDIIVRDDEGNRVAVPDNIKNLVNSNFYMISDEIPLNGNVEFRIDINHYFFANFGNISNNKTDHSLVKFIIANKQNDEEKYEGIFCLLDETIGDIIFVDQKIKSRFGYFIVIIISIISTVSAIILGILNYIKKC